MRDAILQALAEGGEGVSLPRLSKRLGQSASAVLRELSFMGDAALGGQRGPGWVRVCQEDGRWMAVLTEAGRARVAQAGAS
jgi:DNA-binding IclR family transcriptional regulator